MHVGLFLNINWGGRCVPSYGSTELKGPRMTTKFSVNYAQN